MPPLVMGTPVDPEVESNTYQLDYLNVMPRSGETFNQLVGRTNRMLLASDIKVLSVETVSMSGGAQYLNQTRYTLKIGGRDRQYIPNYQFVRLWFNSLDMHNRTPKALELIKELVAMSELDVTPMLARDFEDRNGACTVS